MPSRHFREFLDPLLWSLIFFSMQAHAAAKTTNGTSPKAASATMRLLEDKGESNGGGDICSMAAEAKSEEELIQFLCEKIQQLTERIDDLETGQSSLSDSVDAVMEAPGEDLRVLGNFILTGTGYTFYTAPSNLNGTFGTVVDPVFLWRYGDSLLFEMKLDITLNNHNTNTQLVYATLDYVANDWLTIRAGKYSTPLGFVWEKMTTGWINKLPNLPLPYNPRAEALTPAAELGIDIRGAIPLNNIHFDCERKIPFVINYDLWVGNGPDEEDGMIVLGTNYNDNNHNIAVGGRIGFRFEPYREIGFSGEWGQWNNNKHSSTRISKRPLYYTAMVLDLHWRFPKLVDILGEFIYTDFGAVPNHALGIHSHRVHQIGGWLQLSSYLSDFYNAHCIKPDIWKSFEGVVRYGFVNSGISDFKGEQWSFGLNYHFNNLVILKFAYDINEKERLGGHNTINIQLAYAY